jgi:hypothetical protein
MALITYTVKNIDNDHIKLDHVAVRDPHGSDPAPKEKGPLDWDQVSTPLRAKDLGGYGSVFWSASGKDANGNVVEAESATEIRVTEGDNLLVYITPPPELKRPR